MGKNSEKRLKAKIRKFEQEHPTGGSPSHEIPTLTQVKIWRCEIETGHRCVPETSFCRCSHVMY